MSQSNNKKNKGKSSDQDANSDEKYDSPKINWYQSTFILSLTGAFLYWIAQPPVGWSLLAWLAPLPWLRLIAQERLLGRRPYLKLWMVGFLMWLMLTHWLRLPHLATIFGWIPLAAYLGFYLPLFVGLTRVAVHHCRLSLLVATPVVWVGLEYFRAHMFTGFLMGSLSHTQYRELILIQISDLAGQYTVCFVMILITACFYKIVLNFAVADSRSVAWQSLLILVLTLAATLGYGYYRLEMATLKIGPRVALIQGTNDPNAKHDPKQYEELFKQYYYLTRDAVTEAKGKLDLLVWPETMYISTNPEKLVQQMNVPMLLGKATASENGDKYNSAVMFNRQGNTVGKYDKMHLVMFGEYIPFADIFPFLYSVTPLTGGVNSGKQPKSLLMNGYRYTPNICYESVLPHVIRGQVKYCLENNEPADVLVNLTNDAWYYGSSELEMHLACGIFRAVECRRPVLIAANTGISASINSNGRIVKRSQKLKAEYIIDDVMLDDRESIYLLVGDWPAGICFLFVVMLFGIGWRNSFRRSSKI